jgi:hypothetical protein
VFDALIHLIVNILNNPAALALVTGVIVVYMSSCIVKPYRICKACRRTKESHSKIFKGAFGACRSCRGRGHHLRLGARMLGKKL